MNVPAITHLEDKKHQDFPHWPLFMRLKLIRGKINPHSFYYWELPKPKDIVLNILGRLTRNTSDWGKIKNVIWLACCKYSRTPKRTMESIAPGVGHSHYLRDNRSIFCDWEMSNAIKKAENTLAYYSDIETREEFPVLEYTELLFCECCGKTAKNNRQSVTSVCCRWDIQRANKYIKTNRLPIELCVSCWNKFKPIAKKQIEANEIKYLTNKLYTQQREARYVQN